MTKPSDRELHRAAYYSPCLSLIQAYLRANPRSTILDLGNFNSTKLHYLSQTPCKIDTFSLSHQNEYQPECLSEQTYDIILCWDLLDYVPLEKLLHLFQYLDKCSKKDSILYFFTRNHAEMPLYPCEFNLFIPNELRISLTSDTATACPRHSALFLKKNLPHFRSQHAFLLKNGLQENIWLKYDILDQMEYDV